MRRLSLGAGNYPVPVISFQQTAVSFQCASGLQPRHVPNIGDEVPIHLPQMLIRSGNRKLGMENQVLEDFLFFDIVSGILKSNGETV